LRIGFPPVAEAEILTPARSSASMKAVRAKAWGSSTRKLRTVEPLPAAIVPLTRTTPGRAWSTSMSVPDPVRTVDTTR